VRRVVTRIGEARRRLKRARGRIEREVRGRLMGMEEGSRGNLKGARERISREARGRIERRLEGGCRGCRKDLEGI
jgi:hypothetical protein